MPRYIKQLDTPDVADPRVVAQADPAASVDSVFGRTGTVVASGGDYTAAQVTGAEATVNKGAAGGYAPLDAGQLVPAANSRVQSVMGRTGVVVAAAGDYTAAQVTGAEQTVNKGAVSGYAPLDAGQLVPAANSRVQSVMGRTGAVVAAAGDYLAVPAGGLTGAVAATRYVGATASGAPITGTFAVGDFIIDQTGQVRVCTVAGTPGTWVAAGPVQSAFGRTGAVVAAAGDYTAAQVTNAVDRSQVAAQSMAGQLNWAPQATAVVRGAQVAANPLLQNFLLAADANPAVQIGGDGKISLGAGGASALDTNLYRSAANYLLLGTADLGVGTVGRGLRVAEGANAKQGVSAAMVAGAVTVANTSVTATSRIIVTRQDGGTNPGAVYVSARTAGTSFTITSTNAADTGTVAYQIFEPA